MESRIWRTISSLKSASVYPKFHVLMGHLTMFDTDGTIQMYNGETWEIASESLTKSFNLGVSIKIPCH